MAKIPNRNHRGVKVHGTGHGRTPIANGSVNGLTYDVARLKEHLEAGDRTKGWAKRARAQTKPKPKKHHPAVDGPAPFKTWAEWRKANPAEAKQAKKVAWRRWRKRKRAKAKTS